MSTSPSPGSGTGSSTSSSTSGPPYSDIWMARMGRRGYVTGRGPATGRAGSRGLCRDGMQADEERAVAHAAARPRAGRDVLDERDLVRLAVARETHDVAAARHRDHLGRDPAAVGEHE